MSSARPARVDDEPLTRAPSAEGALDDPSNRQEAGSLGADRAPHDPASEFETLAGERGISALHRARSLQSRASQVLALALMGSLAVGLLGWYYIHTFAERGVAKRTAQTASRNQAAGDAPLPSLGPITLPEVPVEKILGPAPEEPLMTQNASIVSAGAPLPVGGSSPQTMKSPAEIALERRLTGPAFSRRSDSDSASATLPPESSSAAVVGAPGDPKGEREPAAAGSGSVARAH